MWLGENSVVVTAELPGVTREDVNLSLQEDVLTLAGRRQPAQGQENVNWQRRERAYGAFSRAVQLPFRSIPTRSRHGSITASWKSSCSGWKRTGRERSRSALLERAEGVHHGPGSQNHGSTDAGHTGGTQRIPPRPVFLPPADIYETKDSIVVLAEMPGVPPEGVDLTWRGGC